MTGIMDMAAAMTKATEEVIEATGGTMDTAGATGEVTAAITDTAGATGEVTGEAMVRDMAAAMEDTTAGAMGPDTAAVGAEGLEWAVVTGVLTGGEEPAAFATGGDSQTRP